MKRFLGLWGSSFILERRTGRESSVGIFGWDEEDLGPFFRSSVLLFSFLFNFLIP